MGFIVSSPQKTLMRKQFFYVTDSSCGEGLCHNLGLHSRHSPTQKHFCKDNSVASVFHLILKSLSLLVTVAKVTLLFQCIRCHATLF